MNDLTPDMPSMPDGASQRSSAGSTLLTVGFLLALGFLFSASALIDASEPTSMARYARPAMVAATDADSGGATISTAENHDVSHAVRHWQWETQGQRTERKPVGRYDFEELWLGQY
jgi:hypothetical protein